MESANSHHHHHHRHHLQDQFSSIVASSTSSSISQPVASSSFYGARNDASWNPLVLNTGYNFDLNVNGVHSISRNSVSRHDNDILVPPSLNASSIQDLGFYWAAGANNNKNTTNEALHIAKIKDELSDNNSSSKFSETSNGSSNPDVDFNHFPPKRSHSNNKYEADFPSTLSEKLLFRTFSNGLQLSPSESYSTTTATTTQSCASFGGLASRGGNLGQVGVFPSGNDIGSQQIDSNLTSQLWGSLGVNLQALGLLSSTNKFSGMSTYSGQAAHANSASHNLGLYKDRTSSFGLHELQDSSTTHWSTNSQNNSCSFMSENTEAKRSSCVSEAKASPTAPKKPRVESRSSLTPFKVRKEKLGDRIAALQQLVAPFGKTDTASVLMEAIGYIKFLQDQVETLSVPYMKSARNRIRRPPHEGSSEESHDQGETKRDLRSSGLCLVPLSCMSYFANDGVGVWPPPPSFGGSRT
ncbi:hypothetical protein Sjap_010288 [Stephania japonica]|uniref:BHLH domain-containing protein n=1 Tax=Stephania japonica TaxID=461633 RepID=A0AAP0J963_9MAGN